MNTYILHSDLHKELLAQNRIDPITGDTILEGDEVVFCAGCKSIFLKDTWEYLGKKHCNQIRTLRSIPSTSIKMKLGSDILYYQPANTIKAIDLEITPYMKGWVYKENDTGRFHNRLFGEKEFSFKAWFYVLSFMSFLISNFIIQDSLFFLLSITFTFGAYPFLKSLKREEYKKSLTSKYKDIQTQSFIIKPNGISVCSAYGIKEVFLHSNNLKAITFCDLGLFFKTEIIFEYGTGQTINVPIEKGRIDYNLDNFLNALARLSQGLDFPITLYIKDKENIEKANQFIEEKNAKFTIETRDEYLKEKYEYLYNYKEKIQKLLS